MVLSFKSLCMWCLWPLPVYIYFAALLIISMNFWTTKFSDFSLVLRHLHPKFSKVSPKYSRKSNITRKTKLHKTSFLSWLTFSKRNENCFAWKFVWWVFPFQVLMSLMFRKFSIHLIECFQKVCHLKVSDIFGNFGDNLTTDLRNF